MGEMNAKIRRRKKNRLEGMNSSCGEEIYQTAIAQVLKYPELNLKSSLV